MERKISKELDKIVDGIAKKKNFANAKIVTNWQYIVGKELALATLPWKLTYDRYSNSATLHIYVKDSSTALEISYSQEIILQKITTYFGDASIVKIKTRHNPNIFDKTPNFTEISTKDLLNSSEKSKIKSYIPKNCSEDLHKALYKLALSFNSSKKKRSIN